MNNLHTYYMNKIGLLHKSQDYSIFLHNDALAPVHEGEKKFKNFYCTWYWLITFSKHKTIVGLSL